MSVITIAAGTVFGDLTTTREHVLTLPRVKFGVIGRPSTGKSHLLASLPKPLLGLCGDPEEKLQPYFDRCGDITRTVGQYGQPILIGHSPTTGKPIMQLECFYDTSRENPQAFTALLARSETLLAEVRAGMWASVGFDSFSQFERYALWRRQFGGIFAVKDFDAYGRGAKVAGDDMMAVVLTRLIPLECNVGIAFHSMETARDEGGVSFFGIKAATKTLPTDLASVIPERYRSVSESDGVTRRLWTRPDGRFDLCTLIDAPNPCANQYQALFTNWIAKKVAALEAAEAVIPQPASAVPAANEENK